MLAVLNLFISPSASPSPPFQSLSLILIILFIFITVVGKKCLLNILQRNLPDFVFNKMYVFIHINFLLLILLDWNFILNEIVFYFPGI